MEINLIKLKLVNKDETNWINLSDFIKLGFGLPPKGTQLAIREGYHFVNGSFDFWYKFHEPIDPNNHEVFVSKWGTDIGKKRQLVSDIYIEFTKESIIKILTTNNPLTLPCNPPNPH